MTKLYIIETLLSKILSLYLCIHITENIIAYVKMFVVLKSLVINNN